MFAKNEVKTGPQQIVIGNLQGNFVLGDTINVRAAQFNAGAGPRPGSANAFPDVTDDYDDQIGDPNDNASTATKAKMISLADNEHIKECQQSNRVIQVHDIQVCAVMTRKTVHLISPGPRTILKAPFSKHSIVEFPSPNHSL